MLRASHYRYEAACANGCTGIHIYVGRADFDFFIRLSIRRAVNARRHAGSRDLCLLACVVALWSARICFTYCFVQGCLRCAVLCVQ